jgi:hypothetical protein
MTYVTYIKLWQRIPTSRPISPHPQPDLVLHTLNAIDLLHSVLLPRNSVRVDLFTALGQSGIKSLTLLTSEPFRAEHDVHILQSNALGLRQKKVAEDHATYDGRAEKKERAVLNVGDHIWSRVGDYELAQPLCAGREDQTDLPDSSREDLSTGIVSHAT